MNIFKKVNYDMFKILSSKDREFNYDILNTLYILFCKENGENSLLKEDVIKYLLDNIKIENYKDIDDENDENIKNKEKREIFLDKYIQLRNSGWIEDDVDSDLNVVSNLTNKAISILETLNNISDDDDEVELIGYVYTIYENLNNALKDIDNSIPKIEQAYRSSKSFSNELKKMVGTIKSYTNDLLAKENYQAKNITEHLFEEYNEKIGIKLFNNLKTRDNPTKYSRLIQEFSLKLLDEKEYFPLLMNAYKNTKRKEKLTDLDYKKIRDELYFIYNLFLNISQRIDEIDRKNSSYLKIADEKIKFIINESKDIEESINDCLKKLEKVDENDIDISFEINCIENIDSESIYKARIRNYKLKEVPIENDMEPEISNELKEELLEKIKHNNQFRFAEINKFMIDLLNDKNEIKVSDIDYSIPNLVIKLFLGILYQNNNNSQYKLITLDEEIEVNNFRFNNLLIRRK